MSDFQNIQYHKDGAIGVITLDRTATHNAQNMRMILEIDQALDLAREDEEIRVVVMKGAGKSFSSGHDMSIVTEQKGADPLELEYLARRGTPEATYDHEADMYVGKCLRIRDFPKPTIAMVHGHCVAGGWMVASMCDLVVAADNAIFRDPVARMAVLLAEKAAEKAKTGAA